MADIAETIDLLAFSPKMGRALQIGDLRFQITPRYRYRIVYRNAADIIEIRRVYHPRQVPKEGY